MSEAKVKRGPGRPRKTPLKAPAPKRGILKAPDNEINLVEFEYASPGTFKKFATYWKSLHAEKVGLVFLPDRLLICTREYKENTYVRHRILGAHTTSYYCHSRMEVTLLQKDIDLILQKLDKEALSIQMFISTADRNKSLHFVITTEWDIPVHFDVDITIDATFQRQFDTCFNDDVPYPLHIKLPSKYFKSAISDVKAFDDKWSIEYNKCGGGVLRFPYRSQNSHVHGRDIPPKKMILVDNVDPDDHFNVTIYANVLKPTSQAMLADDIIIRAADDGRFIWLVLDVDNGAAPTDILVKIVDGRKPGTVPSAAAPAEESKEPIL